MVTARTEEEILQQLDQASEHVDSGNAQWPGMTYEEGVQNALAWAIGHSDDLPMAD